MENLHEMGRFLWDEVHLPVSSTALKPIIRILVLLETATVSGPTKNVFQFWRVARRLGSGPGVDMTLATFQRSSRGGGNAEFADAARQLDLPLHCIPERFLFDVSVLSHLHKLRELLKPDLIETHAVKSHALLRLSGLWQEIPWIAFHHGYTKTSLRSPLYNSLDRWSLRAASRVVTMNRVFAWQLALRGVPAERITVLHNAVQLPVHHQVRDDAVARQRKKNDLGISPEERVILCVGRLSREKAHIDMVSALQHLRQMRPHRAVRLIIVGDGPERPRISQAVQSAGLSKHVRLTGQLKDVAPYYQVADVVAIPSLSEGSPNVLLEAMAFGLPVVATSVGGIPEIVTDGETALLVQASDPQAMARAIDLLLSKPDIATNLARQAQKSVGKDYGPDSRAYSLLKIYSELVSIRRPELVEEALKRDGTPS